MGVRSDVIHETAKQKKRKSMHLCVMAHGVGGTYGDWDTWVELLAERYPEWLLLPLRSLEKSCRLLSAGVDVIADLAACEIVEAVKAEWGGSQEEGAKLTLHCVGHSMGGLIIRGALPRLFLDLEDIPFELGHYISLSSPHLGIQSSWWLPSHAWRNLCWLSGFVSNQLLQLAIQDTGISRLPYLVELSNPAGEHLPLLARFRHRTCVTLASGDPLISLPSGVIDPGVCAMTHSSFDASFWRFDEHFVTEGSSPFERKLKTSGISAGKLPEGSLKNEGMFNVIISFLVSLWAFLSSFCCVSRRNLSKKRGGQKYGRPSELTSPMSEADDLDSPSQLSWQLSEDLTCKYPSELIEGLVSISWRRVVARAHHWPCARNMHVFLIGKVQEQFVEEHRMSRECIECLVEILSE